MKKLIAVAAAALTAACGVGSGSGSGQPLSGGKAEAASTVYHAAHTFSRAGSDRNAGGIDVTMTYDIKGNASGTVKAELSADTDTQTTDANWVLTFNGFSDDGKTLTDGKLTVKQHVGPDGESLEIKGDLKLSGEVADQLVSDLAITVDSAGNSKLTGKVSTSQGTYDFSNDSITLKP